MIAMTATSTHPEVPGSRIVIDTSAWIECFSQTALGQRIASVLPAREHCIVPTIVQLELSKWALRELTEEERERLEESLEDCQASGTARFRNRSARGKGQSGTQARDCGCGDLCHCAATRRRSSHLRRSFQKPSAGQAFRQRSCDRQCRCSARHHWAMGALADREAADTNSAIAVTNKGP